MQTITEVKLYHEQLLHAHVQHLKQERHDNMLKEGKKMAVQKLTKQIAQIPPATKKVADSIFAAIQILNESKGSATSIPAVILSLFPAGTNFSEAAKEVSVKDAQMLINLVGYSGAKGMTIFKPSFIKTAENDEFGIDTVLELQDLLFEAIMKIRVALADGVQLEDANIILEITPDILAITQQWEVIAKELSDLTPEEFNIVFGHIGYNIYQLIAFKG